MLKIMKDRMTKYMHRGEKGFTLIELLVVIAILGAIAAVVVLNVGGFIGEGVTQAQEVELHNVQTAVIASMAAAGVAAFDDAGALADTSAADAAGSFLVIDYLVGTTANLDCTYTIAADGLVAQTCT